MHKILVPEVYIYDFHAFLLQFRPDVMSPRWNYRYYAQNVHTSFITEKYCFQRTSSVIMPHVSPPRALDAIVWYDGASCKLYSLILLLTIHKGTLLLTCLVGISRKEDHVLSCFEGLTITLSCPVCFEFESCPVLSRDDCLNSVKSRYLTGYPVRKS